MTSFVRNGAKYELFTDDLSRRVPNGVVLRDYREVLPKKFPRYGKRAGKGMGSLAASADFGRANTLLSEGGWWVDTDVICLKSFKPIDCGMQFGIESTVGGPSGSGYINVAVIRLDAGSDVARYLFQRLKFPWLGFPWEGKVCRVKNFIKLIDTLVDPFNVPWGYSGGPDALTRIVEGLGYRSYALDADAFYPIHYNDWRSILEMSEESFSAIAIKSYAIHLWAEMYRRDGVDKGKAIANSKWAKSLLSDF